MPRIRQSADPRRGTKAVVFGAVVVLFVLVFVLRLEVDRANHSVTLLYALPIAVIAVELGMAWGLAAAAVGLAMFAVWALGWASGDHYTVFDYVVRGVVFFVLGGLVGKLADRLRGVSEESSRFWELSCDLFCTAGFDGYFRRLNPAWEQVLGWTLQELRSQPFLDLVHPEDRARTALEAARLADADAETVSFENRYRRKDGDYRTLTWSARSVPAEGLIYATARDSTERTQAHEELRRSEDFLDSVLEHLPNMVFVKDAEELRFVRLNAAGERLLGCSRTELITKSDYDLFPLDQAEFFVAKDRQVLAAGELVDIAEEPIETRHHGTRYLHTRKIPLFGADGRPRYLLGISEDITERKRTEAALAERFEAEQRAHADAEAARERLSQLLALTDIALAHHGLEELLDQLLERVRQFLSVDTVAILLVDEDGGALVARAAKGLEEEVERRVTIPLGKGFAGRVAAERRPVVIDELERAEVANPLLREKGLRSLLGVPLLVEGEAVGVLHVGTLTPRQFEQADTQLLQLVADRAALAIERARLFEAEQRAHAAAESARVEADHANRAKSEFLSRMSHELRTPLNAILGFGQLLEGEPLNERQHDDVKHILKAGRHLLELINEVLEISRIEAGQLALSPEPVPVAETVREVLALVRPMAAERGIQLRAEVETLAQDGHVHADRQRLRQVLLNLLSNAIKYNRPDGRVEVSFESTSGGQIRTRVADTGIGIDPERIARLFEPFERLGAEQSEIEGTGLGLALSKRLVEAMGGSLTVDPTPELGTTFIVELNATDRPGKLRADEIDRLAGPELDVSLGPRSRLILYIEDNLSNLTLVERILERHSTLKLASAMQGRLGLDLACQHHPDLIILDLHLPDMSGEEVLRHLKADAATREIPVVILSADASTRQAARLRRQGADDYLTKPLDVNRFLDTLVATLGPSPNGRNHHSSVCD